MQTYGIVISAISIIITILFVFWKRPDRAWVRILFEFVGVIGSIGIFVGLVLLLPAQPEVEASTMAFETKSESLGFGTVSQLPTKVVPPLGIGIVTVTRAPEKHLLGKKSVLMEQNLKVGDYVEVKRVTIKRSDNYVQFLTVADKVNSEALKASGP